MLEATIPPPGQTARTVHAAATPGGADHNPGHAYQQGTHHRPQGLHIGMGRPASYR